MKFKILITATLDIPMAELREEISADEDSVPAEDMPGAVQEYINDNLTNLSIEGGDTEIGAVEVRKA